MTEIEKMVENKNVKKIQQIINDAIKDNSVNLHKAEQSETITFYKDPNIKDWAESEYAWCERPCDSNMSMRAIDKKGSIVGYASEHYWTWCDVKEVKKVSAIEFMRHFASKQSDTVKEFAEKLTNLISEHDYELVCRGNGRDRGMFTNGILQAIDEIAAEFGVEE